MTIARIAGLSILLMLSSASLAQEPAEVQPPAAVPAEEPAPTTDAPTPSAEAAATAPDLQADAGASLATLSPLIGDVQIVGPWTDGDRRGIWRTVMLQSLGQAAGNRFFVQQIEDVAGTIQVSSSTEITEVAEIDGAVVGYRVDEPLPDQPEQLTLFLDIVPLDGQISESYELFFTAGEPYRFGPASN